MIEEYHSYILEDCVEDIIDYRGKSPTKVGSGVPLITAKIIKNGKLLPYNEYISETDYPSWMRRGIPQVGDVILTTEAPLGEVAQITDSHVALAQRVILIRGKPDVLDNTYLKYMFMSNDLQGQLKSRESGTTVIGIKQKELRKLILRLPPLPVQKKIAAILSSLDDKIEINTRMNKVLEETARALFHRWFVEFEFPNDEGKPYKSSGGRMIASEMGEIPEGWTIKRAQEICNISIGKTPPRKETQWFTSNSSDVKWISISDMGSSGMFVLDSSEYLTVDAIEKFNIVTVPKDTVILSFKLTIGRVSITSEDLVTNEAIAHFKTNIQELREYLYFTLKCYDYVSLGSTSSIATAINSKIIKNMNILLPHINLIKDYHALVLPIFEIIRTNQTEINQLKKIRETVLPKLMGGGIIS